MFLKITPPSIGKVIKPFFQGLYMIAIMMVEEYKEDWISGCRRGRG